LSRFLIFFFPALADTLLGMIFFVASVRMAESGAGALAVTAVTAVWAIVYMLASQVAGRLVREANCVTVMIGGCAVFATASVAFVQLPAFKITYPLMGLVAIGTAMFFTPFQVFMKAVEKGDAGALPRSVGLYTFSWSAGMAAGPFIGAYIWKFFDWPACYYLNVVICVIIVCGILFLKHHATDTGPRRENAPTSAGAGRPRTPGIDYAAMPDLAWLSWICAGVGCLTVAVLRSYLPSSATAAGIPRSAQGVLLGLLSASQALTGLALCRSRKWMYEPLPVVLFATCGVIALVLFGSTTRVYPLALAAVLYGVYSGSFFFYLVFHALVHPERSTKYVGVNESVVGFTAIVGPLVAGMLADGLALAAPYWVAAFLVLAVLVFQAVMHRKYREAVSRALGRTQRDGSPAEVTANPLRG
jgi:MFS family permease